jgi:GT2 family glycosyltransferase
VHRDATFVDGTCILVPASTTRTVGLLDQWTFPHVGWGANIDYVIRVLNNGGQIVITEASYLNHLGHPTFTELHPEENRHLQAIWEARVGLRHKWGADWRGDNATALDAIFARPGWIGVPTSWPRRGTGSPRWMLASAPSPPPSPSPIGT